MQEMLEGNKASPLMRFEVSCIYETYSTLFPLLPKANIASMPVPADERNSGKGASSHRGYCREALPCVKSYHIQASLFIGHCL